MVPPTPDMGDASTFLQGFGFPSVEKIIIQSAALIVFKSIFIFEI